MRLVIIGGGTAGLLSAAHISQFHPEIELIQVYDSSFPSISVGEGSLPFFPLWLNWVTGYDFEVFREKCHATHKLGFQFEGWGSKREKFYNLFDAGNHAYHFSAIKLAQLLDEWVDATYMDHHVEAIKHEGDGVIVRLVDGSELTCDYVLDCRGFPHKAKEQLFVFD